MENLNNELLLKCVGGSKLSAILNKVVEALRKLTNMVLIVQGGSR